MSTTTAKGKLFKYGDGTVHPTKDYGDIIIIGNSGVTGKRNVTFKRTGHVRTDVCTTSIRKGLVRDVEYRIELTKRKYFIKGSKHYLLSPGNKPNNKINNAYVVTKIYRRKYNTFVDILFTKSKWETKKIPLYKLFRLSEQTVIEPIKRKFKYDVGSIVKTKNSGNIEIIDSTNCDYTHRNVKFLDTNQIKYNADVASISAGTLGTYDNHCYANSKVIYAKGTKHMTSISGEILILDSSDCVGDFNKNIKFLDTGTIVKNVGISVIFKSNFSPLSVKKPDAPRNQYGKYKMGTIHTTEKYGDYVILDSSKCERCKRNIQFLNTGTIIKNINIRTKLTRAGKIRDYSIKPRTKYSEGSTHYVKSCGNVKITKIKKVKNNSQKSLCDIIVLDTGKELLDVTVASVRVGNKLKFKSIGDEN